MYLVARLLEVRSQEVWLHWFTVNSMVVSMTQSTLAAPTAEQDSEDHVLEPIAERQGHQSVGASWKGHLTVSQGKHTSHDLAERRISLTY